MRECMSEFRRCPFCHDDYQLHEVADDGTIPTWVVTWEGLEQRILSPERQRRLEVLRAKYGRVPDDSEAWGKPGYIGKCVENFFHYEQAVDTYEHIKRMLINRGDWEEQQAYLMLTEGERMSWDEYFEWPGIGCWQA